MHGAGSFDRELKRMTSDQNQQEEPRHDIAGILQCLSSADPGPGWAKFLDHYAQLIMNVAYQIEFEQDRIDECFSYVCAALSDDGFKRLLMFNTNGAARFRTWLTTVVFNLCIDWHRKEFGQVRLLPAISALPAFDQSVYRLVVEQGLEKESCYQVLKSDFPELTREMVGRAAARVHSVLTPRQRWQITVRLRGRRQGRGDHESRIQRLPDFSPGPDELAEEAQETAVVKDALARLPNEHRLLLALRFQEGLSLDRIAALMQLGDSNRAWRHLQDALRALSEQLDAKRSATHRKK